MAEDEKGEFVKPLLNGDGKVKARSGKPRKIPKVAMISRTAGMGGMGMGNAGSVQGSGGNFYSPELSTDFLELPQSLHEQWNYYRFFYRSEAFVGQAIDLHTELPLSKIRIGVPKCKNRDMALAAYRFCDKWARRINLMDRLQAIVHERNLLGEVFIWFEDATPEMPPDVRGRPSRILDEDGNPVEHWIEYDDADERAFKWLKKNYKGWTSIRVLPPEQIRMESFNFTSERIIELIPDSKTKDVIERAKAGDTNAQRVVVSMPVEVVKAVIEGSYIPLNTDPDAGSFVYYLANRKSDYEPRGRSLLERCFVPGTPITVLRDNTIIRVPVESVNTDTDLLLTHAGYFRKAVKGSRPVSELVTEIFVEGLTPIRVTAEHRILVVHADGSETWVHAEDLKPGDTVREAHVLPEGAAPTNISLTDWWSGRTLTVPRRVRSEIGADTREIRVVASDISRGMLRVTFEHEQDHAGRADAMAKAQTLLDWAKTLEGPTVLSYEAVRAATGLTKTEIRGYSQWLRAKGLLRSEPHSLGRGRGRVTTWQPVEAFAVAPDAVVEHAITSPITEIPITEDFMYLLGTWIGDGCVWSSSDCHLGVAHIEWSISQKDNQFRDRVVSIARTIFGDAAVKVGNLIPAQDSTVLNVRVEDMLLARWFHDEFGVSAQTKLLPLWVFQLSEPHIMAFLRGVLDTDGGLRVSRQASIEITLDNEMLVRQLHLLCNRVGIKSQVYTHNRKARTWPRTWKAAAGVVCKTYSYGPKTYWKLGVYRHADVHRWAHIGSVKGSKVTWAVRNPGWGASFQNGWLCRKVIKTEKIPFTGDVFSFDVEQFESLVAGDLAVHNCIRALVYRDKLRQAQTSIASRHMTPIRIVYGENMDAADVEALREQVDMSLQDPDYSIIANFQINWEEMGADQRLLDLNTEYDLTDRQLYAGMGVTEGLLSGESAYSGDKINIEVINTRYMLLREQIQALVENYFFKPMCARMGFVDTDEDGDEYVVVPTLSFTRLALRDNRDTFDALYNLYQKGSLDVETILELLNLDPVTVREKLEKDLFTVNDPTFNEVLRGIYGDVGRALAEKSDAVEKIAENLGLKYMPPKEEGDGRF